MPDSLGNIRKVQDKGIVLVELKIYLGRPDEIIWHHLRTTQIHNRAELCIDGSRNKNSTKVEDSPHEELKFELNLQG